MSSVLGAAKLIRRRCGDVPCHRGADYVAVYFHRRNNLACELVAAKTAGPSARDSDGIIAVPKLQLHAERPPASKTRVRLLKDFVDVARHRNRSPTNGL